MHKVSELDRVELARRSYPPLAYLPSYPYGTPSAKGFLHYWTKRDGLIRPPVNHVFLLSFPFLSVPIFHFYFSTYITICYYYYCYFFFGFHPSSSSVLCCSAMCVLE